MKPTQEQIEAALAYNDQSATDQQRMTLHNVDYRYYTIINALTILSAAYRELQEENNRLKAWADLAVSSNALLEIERFERKCALIRKEKL
jgi:hypothetical protein